jgi:hypothetical protein
MTSSGRTTQPAKGTNRCTRSMNGHILHRFAAGRSPFQLTSANHRHASSGWGEAPLDIGRCRVSRLLASTGPGGAY